VVHPVFAHPIPKQNHDRTIEVCLTPDAVVVKYQLEIDEYRAVQDLDKEDLSRIESPRAIPRVFLESAAPILRNNLIAQMDGEELSFQGSGELDTTVKDHLKCDFTFTARWKPSPGRTHRFTFREANYDREDFDRIQLALSAGSGVTFNEVTVPDKALWERPPLERNPGDTERLRRLSASFVVGENASPSPAHEARRIESVAERHSSESGEHPQKLLHLLVDTQRGVVMLLLLAAGFGAVHALTPGHGKTLVAAYLVGEHGTVGHALILGLMTTLTHTAAVFVLAIVFMISPTAANLIYYFQGLVGGLLITGLGLWLLLQRLFGRPDHFHLGGHSHHHHHHAHEHEHAPTNDAGVRWWHLVLLGIRGGLVPCWDAILLFCLAISAGRLWLGVPLLLAFSTGLAGVLVALGISVVWARNWAVTRWSGNAAMGKTIRALPLVSAAVITALGLWLCYDSLHPEMPRASSSVSFSREP
jgi:ABC-type nickel/cobalt efflux system permease component RcnA